MIVRKLTAITLVGLFALVAAMTFLSTPSLAASATTGLASNVTESGATLEGTLNPEGEVPTECSFEYATDAEYRVEGLYGHSVPCAQTHAQIGAGSEPVAVTAAISGLRPSTTYHFRLVGTLYGEDETFTTSGPPTVGEQSFSDVGSSSATLAATANADGFSSTYRFEYGTTASYGSTTSTASLGDGNRPVGTRAQLEGLQPDTTYHFRLLVTNVRGTATGPDIVFATLPVGLLGLPDERGYELVSPVTNADGTVYEPSFPGGVNGGGGEGDNTERPIQAAADGSGITYVAGPAAGNGTGSAGTGGGNQYLAERNPTGGWTSVDIEPFAPSLLEEPNYQAFSSDLSVGILGWNGQTPLAQGAPGQRYPVLYARLSSDGDYRSLLTAAPPNRTADNFAGYEVRHTGENALAYAGGNAGTSTAPALSHLLFEANDTLTPDTRDGGEAENNLYDSTDGGLRPVNILPNGEPAPNATFGAPVLEGESLRINSPDFSHVISEDGARIVWTSLTDEGQPEALYVRENGATTIQIDAAVGGGGRFWTANTTDSRIFFTKGDLYEYDLETGQTIDLASHGEVQGVLGASEDGAYVYFAAKASLAPGVSPQACDPKTKNLDVTCIYLTMVSRRGSWRHSAAPITASAGMEVDSAPVTGRRVLDTVLLRSRRTGCILRSSPDGV